MEFPVTADQVRQTVRDYGIQWWGLRQCSICGSTIGYLFAPDASAVAFTSNCDCTRYHSAPEERDFENVAQQFNMQSTPGVAQQMWDGFLKGATKQPPKPVGEVLDVGTQNPRIKVTPSEVAAWLRSIADAHGFKDRESVAVQIAWDELRGEAPGDYHREVRLAVPELIIMVSNIPNSRVPS